MTQISVDITFPGGDREKPVVTNSTDQDNPIAADQTVLEWKADTSEDDLELLGVTFYTSKPVLGRNGKYTTTPVTPAFLSVPGGHANLPGTSTPDKTTWQISFIPGAKIGQQTVLWYVLNFKDTDFADLDWDPKLTISPR